MSCDLMVFERTKAPEVKKGFFEWYEKQTEWGEAFDGLLYRKGRHLRVFFMESVGGSL